MTVFHTIASTRADHGGTSRSVPALCDALGAEGVGTRLVTTAPADPAAGEEPLFPGEDVARTVVEVQGGWRGRLRSPFAFRSALAEAVRQAPPDVIHDHGAWLPSNRAASLVAQKSGIPFVATPRGMLTDWAFQHHGLKKRAAWHLYQRRTFGRADLFHVTSQEEVENLRRLGFEQPAAMVPNGVPLPETYKTQPPEGETRTALFLSRIHPKKGLPMLLEAWKAVNPPGWRLVIAGPSEGGHRAELEQQAQALGLGDAVSFPGTIPDDEKWAYYRASDLFALPTYSENFGIVVAEALASGIPAITTQGAPWQELETEDCGWWTEISTAALTEALREAVTLSDEERLAMGERGRRLVKARYSWARVARDMRDAYHWVAEGGTSPGCVLEA